MKRWKTPVLILAAIIVLYILSGHKQANAHPSVSVVSDPARVPVLVELFTSEGCSSCPPADALLQELDRSQPVSGAQLIVLSEHVDYWNSLGWRDPYSSRQFTERQNSYARRFGLSSVYTPQMVVDGRFELVGSDEAGALEAVQKAIHAPAVPIQLSSIHLEPSGKIALHIEAGPLPASISAKSAEVWLAIADDKDESHVSGGENSGRNLAHVAVLRKLVQAGEVDGAGVFARDIEINLENANAHNLRVAAIVQGSNEGRVWGVASARLAN